MRNSGRVKKPPLGLRVGAIVKMPNEPELPKAATLGSRTLER